MYLRPTTAVIVTLAATLLASTAARAESTASITVGPDPVESITTQLGLAGTTVGTSNDLDLTVKPTGGPACGANPSADTGSSSVLHEYAVGAGPYAKTANWTFRSAGVYLLCGWITDTSQPGRPVAATATQTITVRPPHLSLSMTAPALVTPGRTFQVTTTAQAEAQRLVYDGVLPDTGRGCPANWSAAESTPGLTSIVREWSITGGPTSDTRNLQLNLPGHYLLCAYFNYEGVAPEATATGSLTVASPCVVPRIHAGASLTAVKLKLVAAGCVAGKVRHAASRRYRRGTVIRLSPNPGTTLSPQAAVAMLVSSGRPRHHRRG